MKGLISLAVVVAFFVTIPQCLGQSQDAEKDAGQLLTEQQLVQMFHLVMVQGQPEIPICHVTPAGGTFAQGFILLVNEMALGAHLNHGDCEEYNADSDDPGEPCSCRPCPPDSGPNCVP